VAINKMHVNLRVVW